MDCEVSAELLACGIELVVGPPAVEWRLEASRALEKHSASELKFGASARYTNPKAGGGVMGAVFSNGGGKGKGGSSKQPNISATAAARNKRSMEQYQAVGAAIDAKTSVQAAWPVCIYVWAEGTQEAVQKQLGQMASAFINQFNAVSFKNRDGLTNGNTFRIVTTKITPVRKAQSGQAKNSGNTKDKTTAANDSGADGLAEVRARAYEPYFAPEPSVLSALELATLWHIPSTKDVKSNRLVRAGAISPTPEFDLVHETRLPDGQTIKTDERWRRVLGYYTLPDTTRLYVGLSEQGILRGMYLPAKPGSGKSSDILIYSLQGLLRNDEENVGKGGSQWRGNSIILTDPNGDLTKDFLNRVPRGNDYEDRVLVVDQTDPEWVVGLNLMARRPPRRRKAAFAQAESLESAGEMLQSLPISKDALKTLTSDLTAWGDANNGGAGAGQNDDSEIGRVAASVLNIFIRNLGVNVDRTPNIFRIVSNAVRLAVEADPHATLLTLTRLIQDPSYRQLLLAQSSERISAAYFAEGGEFDALFKKGGAAPAMGRLETLLRQETIRRIFCQRHQTLDIRDAADKGYVILFYFNPDMEGDKAFSMGVIFTLITQAIFSRTDITKEERRTVEVYLDEFQEMVNSDKGSLEQWLSQARKFGGAICLAHQYLAQIKQYWEVIKGTVGSFLPMQLDRGDAEEFADDFATSDWPENQILRAFDKLPPFSKIAKLYDNNRKHRAVLLKSLMHPPAISNADTTPLLIAIADPKRLRGYRLEPYGAKAEYAQALQIATTKGREGLWEPTAYGHEAGIKPATREYCQGLAEEMTAFLYGIGQLNWRLVSPDANEAEVMGLSEADLMALNSDLHKLKQYHELLIQVEALPLKVRIAQLVKLSNRDWQLYLASRNGRNLALNALLGLNPGLIPNAQDRIWTRSQLKIATPIAEIEAESARPDPFLVRAERDSQKRRQKNQQDGEHPPQSIQETSNNEGEILVTEDATAAPANTIVATETAPGLSPEVINVVKSDTAAKSNGRYREETD